MGSSNWPQITPAGDSALRVEFGDEISLEINRKVHTLAEVFHKINLDGLGEAVPAYTSLLVHYDPLKWDYAEIAKRMGEWLKIAQDQTSADSRQVEIPVIYGGEAGPDLLHVAELHGFSTEEVIRLHSAIEYRVYMLGFTPGFAYLGEVDERIASPRLASPRSLVRAGSVGIAGKQTGIYPIDSPGGWQLIGISKARLFDPQRNPPSLLAPGDRVRFVPIPGEA